VLGELYDFMLQLPNFCGVKRVFGILATFEAWRVYWLPGADSDTEASKTERQTGVRKSFETPTKGKREDNEDGGSPPGLTPSKRNPVVHIVEEDGAITKNNAKKGYWKEVETIATKDSSEMSRVMHGSKVYCWDEGGDQALRAVAGALCKMARAGHQPFCDPFDKLDERAVLCFEKGEGGIFWSHVKHLSGRGNWVQYGDPPNCLYAIEDLGRGADGRVWLMCSHGGAVCVLKFSKQRKGQFAS
jgi:hypothetical protein